MVDVSKLQRFRGTGLRQVERAGKSNPMNLLADSDPCQADEVHYVSKTIQCQLSERCSISSLVATPKPHGLKAIDRLDFRVTCHSECPLHRLQPTPITQ